MNEACFILLITGLSLTESIENESLCHFNTGLQVHPLHDVTVVINSKTQTLTPLLSFYIYTPKNEQVRIKIGTADCDECQDYPAQVPDAKYPCLHTFQPVITKENVGELEYKITATAVNESAYGLLKLSVHEPTSILNKSRSIAMTEGTSGVSLVCLAEGFPLPKIKWTKDGKELSNSTCSTITEYTNIYRRDVMRTTVIVGGDGNIKYSDRGIYECTANNSVGYGHSETTDKRLFHLDVLVPIEPIHARILYQANASSTIKIFAEFRAHPPPQHVVWNLSSFYAIKTSTPTIFKYSGEVKVIRGIQTFICDAYNEVLSKRYHAQSIIEIIGLENTKLNITAEAETVKKYIKEYVQEHGNDSQIASSTLTRNIFLAVFTVLLFSMFIFLLLKKTRTRTIWVRFIPGRQQDDEALVENVETL